MKQACLVLLCGLTAALMQGALLYIGLPSFLLPQLVLILVVYLGFHEVSFLGACSAFALGLLMDFASAVLVGPWAGAFVAVYGALSVGSQRLFVESAIVMIVTAFCASLCADFIFLGLAYEYQPSSASYLMEACGQALATALIAPVAIAIFSKILRRKAVPALGRVTAAGIA